MQRLKTIFRVIWSVYAVLIFAVLLFIAIPLYTIGFLIIGEKFLPIALNLNHHFFARWIMFPLYLIRVKVKGKEHIEKRPYVIVSNHRSTIDIIVNATAMTRFLR